MKPTLLMMLHHDNYLPKFALILNLHSVIVEYDLELKNHSTNNFELLNQSMLLDHWNWKFVNAAEFCFVQTECPIMPKHQDYCWHCFCLQIPSIQLHHQSLEAFVSTTEQHACLINFWDKIKLWRESHNWLTHQTDWLYSVLKINTVIG